MFIRDGLIYCLAVYVLDLLQGHFGDQNDL